MIRLAILVAAVVVFPAVVLAMITFALLTAANWKARTAKIVLSGSVGALFVVGALALNTQRGFVVAPGFVVVGTVVFVLLSGFRPDTAIRHRVGVAILLAVAIVGGVQVAAIDGFRGAACSTILGDHTEYAPSYSASGFSRITTGMSVQDVEALVGRPLEEWTVPGEQGQLYWRWTKSRNGSHYYRYRVAKFRDAHLEEKSAFFFCGLD